MNFTTEELCASSLAKLYDQKRRNSFCDLTLLVNHRVVKAHRNVLSAASPYFESILKHHKVQREQLTVTCGDADVFERLVDYAYTGHIQIERGAVEELLRLADHFLMTKIIEYCVEFLGTQLGNDNCLLTYYLTQRFKLKQLGSLVENWIRTHLVQILDGDEANTLATPALGEFLKNKMFAVPFIKQLKIISDWTLRNVEQREVEMNKLLGAITWTNVDHNEVYKHLETCELYKKSELSLYYLLHHLLINNLFMESYKVRYDELHSKYEQMLRSEEKTDQKLAENSGIVVKARNRHRKEQMLARLLAGLKPSLRSAAIKAIRKQNKTIQLVDYLTDNIDVDDESDSDERVGVKCPICSANINDSMLLEQHLALSHSKDVTYKCGICNFVCQYHGDYLNHTKTHFPGPPFRCDFCDFDTDNISKLVAHRAKHLEDAVYQCTFCSFKCRSKPNYLSHLKLHSPPAEKQFKCEQCTKSFKYKHNLESHLLTHSNEKTLHCESCGFHTKFLSHMIAHKRIHAGDMYKCYYPHCKYSTSKKQQLVTHAKTHNGLRPHTCTVCGRGFMEKSHLVRHERIHLEEKPFKCTNCDYTSSRRDKLKEHFTRHHGENASAKVPYKARPLRGTGSAKNKSHQNAPHANAANNNVEFANGNGSTPNGASNGNSGNNVGANGSGDMQELIMQHHNQNGAGTNGYHHFGEATDFHHHSHNLQHLHNQRNGQHHNNMNHHHMLGRSNSTATTTAAAVAAAMMLDPRFHHNSTVAYPTPTPVTMAAMAAAQSSQQIQSSSQHVGEYPPSLQNCMTLF